MDEGWKEPLFLLKWMEKYNTKVMEKLEAIQNMFGTAGDADATAADIKIGKKAYNGTTLITGSMQSNTAEQKTLACGQSYSIAEGYHDGTGTVTAMSLASQTEATAGAGDILDTKTAFVNGTQITGTMANQGAKTKELACGEEFTIASGYHNGLGKVTAKSLASQTDATASAPKLLSGLTAWVKGSKITGTMANKAGTTVKASAVTQDDDNTYFSIPAAGYYDTSAKVYTPNSNLKTEIITKTYSIADNSSITANFDKAPVMLFAVSNRSASYYSVYIDGVVVAQPYPSGCKLEKITDKQFKITFNSGGTCTIKYVA